jgi:hypothetical protein
MKPERRLIELMRDAQGGRRVCVIGDGLPNTHVDTWKGIIFFRNHITNFLMTLRVDTVWFMDYPVPEEVELLGCHMTSLSKDPRILKGNE